MWFFSLAPPAAGDLASSLTAGQVASSLPPAAGEATSTSLPMPPPPPPAALSNDADGEDSTDLDDAHFGVYSAPVDQDRRRGREASSLERR